MYSRCALTKETDKLVALSGLSKELQRVLQDDYLAGLWRRDLECQLLWEVRSSYHGRRPSVYVAPSWSWASLCGASVFPDPWVEHPSKYKSLVSIEKARVTFETGTQSHKITDVSIILRGQLVLEFDYRSPDMLDVHNNKWKPPLRSHDYLSPDIRNTIQEKDGTVTKWRSPIKADDLWYLPVKADFESISGHESLAKMRAELAGLVLQRIKPEGNEFLRYGTFRIKLKEEIDWFWQSYNAWEKTALSDLDTHIPDSKLYDGIIQYDPLIQKYKVADNVRQYTIVLK